MTTIISRLYDSTDTARAARSALRDAGHDAETIDIIGGESVPDAPPLTASRITAAGVGSTSAEAYAAAARPGQALLVVRAPFTPFGRARSAIAIADRFGPVAVPGTRPNQHVPDQPRPEIFHPAIARHALVLTTDMPPRVNRRRGPVSAAFGVPMILASGKGRRLPTGRLLSRLLALPLLSGRRPRRALLPAGSHLSRLFWPLPLLSGRARS